MESISVWMTPRQTAQRIGVSVLQTLQPWRLLDTGLPYVKLGTSSRSKVRYRLSDVEEYLEQQKGGQCLTSIQLSWP